MSLFPACLLSIFSFFPSFLSPHPPCPTHSVLRSFLPSFLLSLFPSFPISFFPSSTIALFLRSSFPSIPSSSCHSFPTSCPHNLFDRSLHHALIFLPPLPSSVSIPYPAKCPSIVHERFKTASSENKIIINRQASKPQSLRVPRRDSRRHYFLHRGFIFLPLQRYDPSPMPAKSSILGFVTSTSSHGTAILAVGSLQTLLLTIFTCKILPRSPLDLLVMPSKPSTKRLFRQRKPPNPDSGTLCCLPLRI